MQYTCTKHVRIHINIGHIKNINNLEWNNKEIVLVVKYKFYQSFNKCYDPVEILVTISMIVKGF